MFRRKPKVDPNLDPVVESILLEMNTYGPDSEEYTNLLGHLERVYAMRQKNDSRRVSPDTVVLVAGNLLGILIIVAYEQKHVMTSKGLGLLLKTK